MSHLYTMILVWVREVVVSLTLNWKHYWRIILTKCKKSLHLLNKQIGDDVGNDSKAWKLPAKPKQKSLVMQNGSSTITQRRGNYWTTCLCFKIDSQAEYSCRRGCVFGGINLVSFFMGCSNGMKPLLGLNWTQLKRSNLFLDTLSILYKKVGKNWSETYF